MDLGRLRLILEEEDIGERMAGAEHRHVRLVAAAHPISSPELVDLGDGLLQVTVADLVGRAVALRTLSSFCPSAPSP